MPKYRGPNISVEFEDFPHLKPRLLPTQNKKWFFQRFLGARARRDLELTRDWRVKVGATPSSRPLRKFQGTIIIPGGTTDTYDGASVPLPWTVTFLSLGTLRPLGILLTASIVHDYAFRHGALPYDQQNGTPAMKAFRRHDIDLLFREMIRTVNKTPFLAYTAWFAVRIGWLRVKYNGQPRTGKAPVVHLTVLAVLLAVSVLLVVAAGDAVWAAWS